MNHGFGTTGLSPMRCEQSHITSPENRAASVVRVRGDVNWITSRQLRDELKTSMTAGAPARLIVDLRDATHVDSSGLGALLEAMRDADQRRVRFTLSGLSRSLTRILDRTHLTSLFDISPSVEEALQT